MKIIITTTIIITVIPIVLTLISISILIIVIIVTTTIITIVNAMMFAPHQLSLPAYASHGGDDIHGVLAAQRLGTTL